MKRIIFLWLVVVITGCTTVHYNGAETFVQEISFPGVGEVATVHLGDHMVRKGALVEEGVLVVLEPIDGVFYKIPAQSYGQIGFNNKQNFYSSSGVAKSSLADPVRALSLENKEGARLCVVTVFGTTTCYRGNYERGRRLSEKGNSFQKTLIYSGRVGDRINISYREFSNNLARPAFNNDVEYDLSSSRVIGYKGALLEVIEADNRSITYRLIQNFH